jgi:hypothetical protein
MSDQLITEAMPSAGFEPTIPASEQPQTHALEHVATGTGCRYMWKCLMRLYEVFQFASSDEHRWGILKPYHTSPLIPDREGNLFLPSSYFTAKRGFTLVGTWTLRERSSHTGRRKQKIYPNVGYSTFKHWPQLFCFTYSNGYEKTERTRFSEKRDQKKAVIHVE